MDDTHIPGQGSSAENSYRRRENIREELNFYKTLKDHFKIYGKPTDDLDFIIKTWKIRSRILEAGSPILPDQKSMEEAIAKHPILKIPRDYLIRLLTHIEVSQTPGLSYELCGYRCLCG